MKFTQFIDLPMQLTSQIIRKCFPIPYVRLRQTCRFIDEFCEHNRTRLSIYCSLYRGAVQLFYNDRTKLFYISLRGRRNSVQFQMTPDNMGRINKALSGFLFTSTELDSYQKLNQYNDALLYFLEAVPDLKVNLLYLRHLKVYQVEWVMSSKWKIGGVKVDCQFEMSEILKIDAIKKMDTLYCNWNKEEKYFTEEDIIQLARRKKHVVLHPQFLSTRSSLQVLKAIAQNWKSDGYYPLHFHMTWKYERNYLGTSILEADLSGLYSEIMAQEACHLGSFLRTNEFVYEISDIWIRKQGKKWQIVRIKRNDYQHGIRETQDRGVGGYFTLYTTETTTDFIQKMTAILYEIFSMKITSGASFYEACQTENMRKIKEAFVNIIPNQLPLP